MNCSRVEELEDSYLLGELEEEEAAQVKQHIAGCPVCATRMAANQEVLGSLFAAIEPVTPPLGVRNALLEKVKALPQPAVVIPSRPVAIPERKRKRISWGFGWATGLAAALVLALGMLTLILQTNLTQTTQQLAQFQELAEYSASSDTLVWTMLASQDQRGNTDLPRARMYIRPGSDHYLVTASKLPPAPGGKIYKVWTVRTDGSRPGQPEFVTNLTPDADGKARVEVANPSRSANMSACFVTLETPDSAGPSEPKFLVWNQT